MQKAEHFSANVEGLWLAPTGLSLPVPAVPPTHELFGLTSLWSKFPAVLATMPDLVPIVPDK